jgi:hypothetical protein
VKVGDVVKLPKGCSNHWGLPTGIAVLVEKTPRTDNLEYDWNVFVDGRLINLGRQIEQSAEILNEHRRLGSL